MTGMKKGAGEDPFAEDTDGGNEDVEETNDRAETTTESEERTSTTADTTDTDDESRTQSMQIPYKFRRDGVQDGRSRVPLFLQSETKTAERDALRELEDRFDGNVSLTDLREALVMVGLEHLDEAEAQLESWGYGMTFD
ncbi:hypothetical protein C499_13365 [Halogeometricum borinquense DSM 11551]|uniref:Uncharacterized protein n=2 Tax=Halogeometricum borinquense TaxID=60847 RepID=E4NUL9_HALBP|nr:hypothetical protein [Halogeometricum borinquense]ADQ68739.1 hypothetical protein Hbor_32040 [Halogeometricum borinquense DSM 11551]ELY25478.1 hypothetical protein C499_13365 [Halogeometricum borinquense DSM 11551]RYJ08431.1 hypothetical protein ELS19_18015 [Halogeometricum borinquense]